MCLKERDGNYHLDFNSREEALLYAESLNDSKIEWYGVYEVDPALPYLNLVVSKRLIPHNDNPVFIKNDSSQDNIKRNTRKRKER